MNLSKFPTVRDTKPSETISAAQLIDEIRSDAHAGLCDEIRRAPDKDTRSDLKRRLPAVTASGTFSKRAASQLLSHSGLLLADVDIDDNPQLAEPDQMEALRVRLRDDKHVCLFFVSPSGGLKVGVRVDCEDSESHKRAFLSAEAHFLDSHGLVVDKACKDVSRLCFLSHDAGAHYNSKSVLIKTTAPKTDAVPFWSPTVIKREVGNSPGDQFNERADVAGMLQSQCWTTRDGKYWTRPGKAGGISGTLGIVGERKFYCWTSSAAPLEANETYSPFALYATFYHGGDFKSAAKALAEEGFGEDTIESISPAMQKCIDELIRKHDESYKAMAVELADTKEQLEAIKGGTVLDYLRSQNIATDEAIARREKEAREMVFILPGIAARGQSTVIYASPNSGKTLITMRLLHDQATSGELGDLNVVYCNFDDDFIGANYKAKYMKGLSNIVMIDNQNHGAEDVLKMMEAAIKDGSASSMCFVLDTLIRFVSDSDKKTQRDFTGLIQRFVGAQGSVIALGHTNKHKDGDGKSIHGGTSDIRNSFSQAAILELMTDADDENRVVKFYNDKLRGMAKVSNCYKYAHGDSRNWLERVETVQRTDEAQANAASAALLANHQHEKDKPIIDFICEKLKLGALATSDITHADLVGNPGSSKERAKILDLYKEGNEHGFEYWGKSRSQTNGWNYYLLDQDDVTTPIWGGFANKVN